MSIFSSTAQVPKRYVHNLGFMNTLSMQNFGELYPILAKELVPGDVFKHKHACNMFFFPQNVNVMHGFKLKTYYFFVPYRVVYPDWDKFISQVNGQYQTPFVKPYIQARDLFNRGINHEYWCHGSLSDYLGMNSFDKSNTYLPWDSQNDNKIDTLWHRAYQKIYVDYFIDTEVNTHIALANFVNDTLIPRSGGEDVSSVSALNSLLQLRTKCWSKDLFTTSLKNTRVAGQTPSISGTFNMDTFRQTAALDAFYQALMRIGQRPMEFIRGIFGVTPKDYRLDMAEFLGGDSVPIIKGTVVNHNASIGSDADAQGFIASEFKTGGISGKFKYRCREFGLLMGLATIEPDAVYFQGLPRQFSKQDPSDYFNPYFEHIGDQMTLNQEIYMSVMDSAQAAISDTNKQGFGFAPRYSEYKYFDNELHGLFRMPNAYLNYTAAKQFSSVPSRNSSAFSQIQSPNGSVADPCNLKRIFNITTGTPIAGVQFYHQFKSLRPMDKDSRVYIKG